MEKPPAAILEFLPLSSAGFTDKTLHVGAAKPHPCLQ